MPTAVATSKIDQAGKEIGLAGAFEGFRSERLQRLVLSISEKEFDGSRYGRLVDRLRLRR